MQAMGVADVQRALEGLGLSSEIVAFDSSTATSRQAADNVGCQLGQIVKSLGFMIRREQPVLALMSGDATVDERKLAALFNVGRKRARMMNAEQCLRILGYRPGGVPPIGHRSDGFPIILDERLRRYDIVYAAGGASSAIFPIALADLHKATGGSFADIAKT